jgi:hypothetical protein
LTDLAKRGTTVAIDLDQLEKLCALQATDVEVAAWFNVSTRTIERRRKEAKFAEIMERGKARGRISIRRAQMKMLENGNATMGIWLGKQYLGQTDQVEYRGELTLAAMVVIPRAIPDTPGFPEPEPLQLSRSNEDDDALDIPTKT